MALKIIIKDKLGWPVETVRGRWFFNLIRRIIHGRKVEVHCD